VNPAANLNRIPRIFLWGQTCKGSGSAGVTATPSPGSLPISLPPKQTSKATSLKIRQVRVYVLQACINTFTTTPVLVPSTGNTKLGMFFDGNTSDGYSTKLASRSNKHLEIKESVWTRLFSRLLVSTNTLACPTIRYAPVKMATRRRFNGSSCTPQNLTLCVWRPHSRACGLLAQ